MSPSLEIRLVSETRQGMSWVFSYAMLVFLSDPVVTSGRKSVLPGYAECHISLIPYPCPNLVLIPRLVLPRYAAADSNADADE